MAVPMRGQDATDTGLGIMPYVRGNVGACTFAVGRRHAHGCRRGGREPRGRGCVRVPPKAPHLRYTANVLATAGDASFKVELKKAVAAGAESIVLIGDPNGSRLDCSALHAGIGGENGDFYIAGGATKLRLVLDLSSDGLLGQLASAPLTVEAGDLVAGWRVGRGIYFEQGAGIKVRIPVRTGGSGRSGSINSASTSSSLPTWRQCSA